MSVPTPKFEISAREKIVKLLVVFFTLILPGLLIVFGVVIFLRSQGGEKIIKETGTGSGLSGEGVVKPSELLAEMKKYENEKLTLEGKVTMATMVCRRQACPDEDPCCGCDAERNLVIDDDQPAAAKETVDQLRLLDSQGESFCRRKTNSCQYDCGDWQEGNVYQVEGVFVGEPPPPGTAWRRYVDYYFLVTGKKSVKEYGLIDLPRQLYENIAEIIQRVKKSGYFIID